MKGLLLLIFIFFGYSGFSQYVVADLETYINDIIDNLPGSSGDDFTPPTAEELMIIDRATKRILFDDTLQARVHADSVNYQVTTLYDNGLNQIFYLLEEKSPNLNYWGTFIFNPAPSRGNLVVQSPHPKYDTNTGKQGIYCFKRLNARAFFVSGTHRCNSSSNSSCSGTTEVCGESAPHRISDMPHNDQTAFQKITECLAAQYSAAVFVQLHGFGKTNSDPYVIMSNGARNNPTPDYCTTIRDELLAIDNTLTFKLAHLDTTWTRLIGFTNVQGRLLNNSLNPCNASANTSTGRFIHIEQEKTKLRDNAMGWDKMYVALANSFPAQTNYYVSTSGNDSNAGTFTAPWRTIQKACNEAIPGSTVFIRGGTYQENIWMNVSGSNGNPITFTSYLDEQVVIDGGSTGIFTELFVISGPSYITIDGLRFQNATGNFSKGVYIGNGSDHIQFINNIISNIHFSNNPAAPVTFSTNVNPFVVYNTNANDACTNILIAGNEIFNCRTGYSEALTIAGNVDGFEISNNLVHDITNIGIDVTGGYGVSSNPNTDFARNGVVKGNTTYNCVSSVAVSAGIYVDGGQDIIVEQNISYGNGRGFEIGCEQPNHETTNVILRNNISYANLEAGIGIGGYDYPNTGKVTNCQIINNTFYNNDLNNLYDGELLIEYTENCSIQNNIFYSTDSDKRLIVSRLNSTGLVLDFNLYYHSVGSNNVVYDWEGAYYEGFNSFRNGTGYDTNSKFENPLFEDIGMADFDILPNSPAINQGNPAFQLTDNETDFAGNERLINLVDQGAYEFQGCVEELVLADNLRSDLYVAQNNIFSNSMVNPGIVATLKANTITLENGFHAKFGSQFTAMVDDCDLPALLSQPSTILAKPITEHTSTQQTTLNVYPNPVHQLLNIVYVLPENTETILMLSDLFGRTQVIETSSTKPAGQYEIQLNMEQFTSGRYFLVLKTSLGIKILPITRVD